MLCFTEGEKNRIWLNFKREHSMESTNVDEMAGPVGVIRLYVFHQTLARK